MRKHLAPHVHHVNPIRPWRRGNIASQNFVEALKPVKTTEITSTFLTMYN